MLRHYGICVETGLEERIDELDQASDLLKLPLLVCLLRRVAGKNEHHSVYGLDEGALLQALKLDRNILKCSGCRNRLHSRKQLVHFFLHFCIVSRLVGLLNQVDNGLHLACIFESVLLA